MTFTESIRGTPLEQVEQANLVVRASYRVLRTHQHHAPASCGDCMRSLGEVIRATTEIEQVIAAERRKEGA